MSDTRWQIQQVSDFNDDLHADILWRNSATGQLYVWLLGREETDVKSVSGPGAAGTSRSSAAPRSRRPL